VNLSPAVAEEMGVDPFSSGVLLTKVGGIAAQAGFQRGDVIRAVNGREVSTTAELAAAVTGAGGWQIVIDRGGRTIVAQL
jgi:S1-C subfamily serine protease